MKLAIVDHFGNPGGGSRYLRALVPHLVKLRPDLKITFFGNPEAIHRENLKAEWELLGIQIRSLASYWLFNRSFFGIKGSRFITYLLHRRYTKLLSWVPYPLSGAVHRELEIKIKGFDLAFFPWPYFIALPQLSCPCVAVFHDFNFRYQFSGQGFSKENIETLSHHIPIWLKHCTPIVSTHFIASELNKFYPEYSHKTKVIHLAPMSALSHMSQTNARLIADRFKLPAEYVLYPTNVSPHKNIGPLLSAFYHLKQRGWKVPLVLVGYGTENLYGKVCEIGVERDPDQKEVIGLGYVSNEEIDALIQSAALVISTSLYEAGNGPGLDAWGKGVPVAMSEIPSFLEHVDIQGVTAKIFNPYSPKEIADRIEEVLRNPIQAKADALLSQRAMSHWTWDVTAQKYLDAFDEAVKNGAV